MKISTIKSRALSVLPHIRAKRTVQGLGPGPFLLKNNPKVLTGRVVNAGMREDFKPTYSAQSNRTIDTIIKSDVLYQAELRARKIVTAFYLVLFFFSILLNASAQEPIDFNRLADAVYLAEGGLKAKYPYGVIYKGCTKSSPEYCRKIALNTFKSAYKRFSSSNSSLSYLEYLAASYCPVGAKNDPLGLNKHWLKNVRFFLNKQKGA